MADEKNTPAGATGGVSSGPEDEAKAREAAAKAAEKAKEAAIAEQQRLAREAENNAAQAKRDALRDEARACARCRAGGEPCSADHFEAAGYPRHEFQAFIAKLHAERDAKEKADAQKAFESDKKGRRPKTPKPAEGQVRVRLKKGAGGLAWGADVFIDGDVVDLPSHIAEANEHLFEAPKG